MELQLVSLIAFIAGWGFVLGFLLRNFKVIKLKGEKERLEIEKAELEYRLWILERERG